MKSKNDEPTAIGKMIKKAKATKPASEPKQKDDPIVTFTMNVRKSRRQWWKAQAALKGETMTDVATAALIEAYGLPPEE